MATGFDCIESSSDLPKNYFYYFRFEIYSIIYIYIYIYIYTGCPRRNVPDFGRVFLMLKYTDITRNFDRCYTLVDYQIHINA